MLGLPPAFGNRSAMSRIAAVYNQSLQDALKFMPASFSRWTFKPEVIGDAPHFPSPRLGRASVQSRKKTERLVISSEELMGIAATLRKLASTLEDQVEQPTLELQIGYKLLDGVISVQQCLQQWDPKRKGEVLKGAMRNNLRNLGFTVSTVDADALFDSWDADKGGSLDLKELSSCLGTAQQKAQRKRNAPDPTRAEAEGLRAKAAEAESAAALADRASELEAELSAMIADMEQRADIRLGSVLQARLVRPSAVVTSWGSSRGKHAGTLSRADFRRAVLRLFKGLPPKARGGGSTAGTGAAPASGAGSARHAGEASARSMSSRARQAGSMEPSSEALPTGASTSREEAKAAARASLVEAAAEAEAEAEARAEEAALGAEIDGVFNLFDEDQGGYLDGDEAKAMVKTLQSVANQAASDRRAKEFEARSVRSRANRLGLLAREAERSSSIHLRQYLEDLEC